MRSHLIRRPPPAMVIACLALLVALSGTGYAAIKLPAKSVGTKQLKTGAVTNAKLARRAVTGAKVAGNSLTGTQIKEATLATVPKATRAVTADTATHATAADSATHAVTADAASGIAPPEGWHLVGAVGQPLFQHSWQNGANIYDEPLGFYKDRAGVVHLRGRIQCGAPNNTIFQLPAGYRPATSKIAVFAAACECDAGFQSTEVTIEGSGFSATADGAVAMFNGNLSLGNKLSLDGISFLAES
jgi:hypothetical protein